MFAGAPLPIVIISLALLAVCGWLVVVVLAYQLRGERDYSLKLNSRIDHYRAKNGAITELALALRADIMRAGAGRRYAADLDDLDTQAVRLTKPGGPVLVVPTSAELNDWARGGHQFNRDADA